MSMVNRIKKNIIIIVIVLVLLFVSCILLNNSITKKLDEETIGIVDELFLIELPENGITVQLEQEFEEDPEVGKFLDRIYIEVELNGSDFKKIYEQVDEKYRYSPFLEPNVEVFGEKYRTRLDEIEYMYFASLFLVNPEVGDDVELYERYIYISEKDFGTYTIIFEAR